MQRAITKSKRPQPATGGLAGLHAYQVSLSFYGELVGALSAAPRSHVVRQLQRAAESVVLNIAEAYPATGADRARRFRIAADEATECSAALDLLAINRQVAPAKLGRLRQLNDRQRAMLYRLSRKR